MSFPKRMDVYDVQTRLSKLGADPGDLKVVGAALQAGLQTRDTIEKQRDELARLHKERESAWRSDGCQTHWSHLPSGQLIITVFLGRTVAGLITRSHGDQQYTWVSGRFNGETSGICDGIQKIEKAYAKRSGVKIEVSARDRLLWNDILDDVMREASFPSQTNLLIHQYQTAVGDAASNPECPHIPQGSLPSLFGYVAAENPSCPLESLAGDFIRAFPLVNHATAHVAIAALYQLSAMQGETWSTGWSSHYAWRTNEI